MGLVAQVMDTFPTRTLIRIKEIFATLTVAEISEQALSLPINGASADSLTATLIMSGAINATLVHHPRKVGEAMLRLSDNPSLTDLSRESDIRAYLEQDMYLLGRLIENLKQSSHRLGLSDGFVSSIQRGQQWTHGTNVAIGETTNLEMEEDMMGDLS